MPRFHMVDVFASRAFSGNSLAVFLDHFTPKEMLEITQEFRHYESIFVKLTGHDRADVRIFTVQEELEFAGHPLLGAAWVVAQKERRKNLDVTLTLKSGRPVRLAVVGDQVWMDQGPVEFSDPIVDPYFYNVHGAKPHHHMPMRVVSTGLPYLAIPTSSSLEDVEPMYPADFESRLARLGAKFAYIFNPEILEGRTWDNTGTMEDVATGSAAGAVVAQIHRDTSWSHSHEVKWHQGRFLGRPSVINVIVRESDVWVGGDVTPVARGELCAGGLCSRSSADG